MSKWWNEKDLLDIIPEVCLHKGLSLNEIVDMIYQNIMTQILNSILIE